jgi:hypothetical protein
VKGIITLPELRPAIGQDGNVGGCLEASPVTIEANERDASARRGWPKNKSARLTQVKADAIDSRFAGDCPSSGSHSRSASSRSSRLIIPASLNNAADARNDSR